jgi:hypothetical protein
MKVKQVSNNRNKTNTKLKKAEKEKAVSQPVEYNMNSLYYQKNTTGLGNSLFRGQKFIDFQEPFNDSIKPIRSYVKDNAVQSEYGSSIVGEHAEYCQVEIEDEVNTSEEQIPSNENYHHLSPSASEELQEKNFFSNRSSLLNYLHEQNNRDNKIATKDKLISNSKYFNNLDKKNTTNQNIVNSEQTDSNLLSFRNNLQNTPQKLISYRPTYIEDDYEDILNRNNEKSQCNIQISSERKLRPDKSRDINSCENKTQTNGNLERMKFISNQFSTNTNSKNTRKNI